MEVNLLEMTNKNELQELAQSKQSSSPVKEQKEKIGIEKGCQTDKEIPLSRSIST